MSRPMTEATHQEIINALLSGENTHQLERRLGISRRTIRRRAYEEGLMYSSTKWIRKDEKVGNGTWNLTNDEYTALLEPERDRSNGQATTEDSAEAAEETHVESNEPAMQDPIERAYELLERARQRRLEDRSSIDNLNMRVAELEEQLSKLHKAMKVEISKTATLQAKYDNMRGLVRLQPAMDALEAVL